MITRRAVRTGAKWVGLAAVGVMAALYVANLRCYFGWFVTTRLVLGIVNGCVAAEWAVPPYTGAPYPVGPRFEYKSDGVNRFIWRPKTFAYNTSRSVHVPLWTLLLGVGVPTAMIWRTDVRAARRRRKGGCTECGYDRRGLGADVKCPECGAGTRE